MHYQQEAVVLALTLLPYRYQGAQRLMASEDGEVSQCTLLQTAHIGFAVVRVRLCLDLSVAVILRSSALIWPSGNLIPEWLCREIVPSMTRGFTAFILNLEGTVSSVTKVEQ